MNITTLIGQKSTLRNYFTISTSLSYSKRLNLYKKYKQNFLDGKCIFILGFSHWNFYVKANKLLEKLLFIIMVKNVKNSSLIHGG